MGKGKWNDEGEWVSNLSDQKRVSVRAFKGNLSVDLREYYLKEGDWLPTKKGISLDLEQWAIVKSGMDAVLQKVQQGIHNHVLKLTGERKLQLRHFKARKQPPSLLLLCLSAPPPPRFVLPEASRSPILAPHLSPGTPKGCCLLECF